MAPMYCPPMNEPYFIEAASSISPLLQAPNFHSLLSRAMSPSSCASSRDSGALYSEVTVPFQIRLHNNEVEIISVSLDDDVQEAAERFAARYDLPPALQDRLAQMLRIRQLDLARELIKGMDQDMRVALLEHVALVKDSAACVEGGVKTENLAEDLQALDAELSRRLKHIVFLESKMSIATTESQRNLAHLTHLLEESKTSNRNLGARLEAKEMEIRELEALVASQDLTLKGLAQALTRARDLNGEVKRLEALVGRQKKEGNKAEDGEQLGWKAQGLDEARQQTRRIRCEIKSTRCRQRGCGYPERSTASECPSKHLSVITIPPPAGALNVPAAPGQKVNDLLPRDYPRAVQTKDWSAYNIERAGPCHTSPDIRRIVLGSRSTTMQTKDDSDDIYPDTACH